jgi:hypothetical protein
VRLEHYPRSDEGHTVDEVRAYIAEFIRRRVDNKDIELDDASHALEVVSDAGSDAVSDSESVAFSLDEHVAIFEELNIGFVAVSTDMMDKLLEESCEGVRLDSPEKSPTKVPVKRRYESASLSSDPREHRAFSHVWDRSPSVPSTYEASYSRGSPIGKCFPMRC